MKGTINQVESNAARLAKTVGFGLLGQGLGRDVEAALHAALAGGAVFRGRRRPLSTFRDAIEASIRAIESDPDGRAELFRQFLLKGPYERLGSIPPSVRGRRLCNQQVGSVITFIHSYTVNCFKGAVTELLAAAPCLSLLKQLQRAGHLPAGARLYVGDAVSSSRLRGKGRAKGADFHILIADRPGARIPRVAVAGVAEVKSYLAGSRQLTAQLDQHLLRAARGLTVMGVDYPAERVTVGVGKGRKAMRIAVVPDNWALPRTFRFEPSEHGSVLRVEPPSLRARSDRITSVGEGRWRITLKWSKEAIAAAAYEMTFWYMEKVGEAIYPNGAPREWAEMTPAEAGRNATKMMLYYAIRRCRKRLRQRAIALYNTYGFGFALGMSFRDRRGRREMLWFSDLDEILSSGRTKEGCRIVPW